MSSQSSIFPPRSTTPFVLAASGDADSFALDDIRGATRTPPPHTTPRPVTTPLSNKVSGNLPYSSVAPDKDTAFRLRLAAETADLFLGPMPCKSFLNTFLPLTSNTGGCSGARHAFDGISPKKPEVEMYKPFIEAAGQFASNLVFVDTSDNPDLACEGLKPDIGVYRSGLSPTRITDFSKMEFWVEFKPSTDWDGFRDIAKPNQTSDQSDEFSLFENNSQKSRLTRGQIASYAAAQLATQFRTHVFSLLICSSFARFIRWDRASAVVSERFDYLKDGRYLAEFISRYDSLNHTGEDASVSPESSDELVAKLATEHLACQGDKLLRLMVPRGSDSNIPRFGSYLIPHPKYTSRSPFGRATRSFFAYDVVNEKVVFLKDYWRVDEPGMEKEGDIYAALKEHDVRHIASFDCGGDINNHHTLAHTLKQHDWGRRKTNIPCYRHYRMVLGSVCRDLLSFNSSWEYVKAAANAMEAHSDAYSKAGILHRDISVGNIMLGENGEGILIDWDQSVRVNNLQSFARRPGRTGTWQFVSAKLLSDPRSAHVVEDDRESVIWVLLWISLRFTAHNEAPVDLASTMELFDEVIKTTGGVGGGRLKELALTSAMGVLNRVKFQDRTSLDSLFKELATTFAVRYMKPPSQASLAVLELAQQDETTARSLQGVIKEMGVFQYQERTEKLRSPTWLVETIRDHLQDRSLWPTDDQAISQYVGAADGTRKRTLDQARMELQVPRQHKIPKTV